MPSKVQKTTPLRIRQKAGQFSTALIKKETLRLHKKLQNVGFNEGYCQIIAPLTLEINKLKKIKNAIILAHSYQTADIMYGVADFVGDSYQLSEKARQTKVDTIIFAGVRFMAETAKILNPTKTVILPAVQAGCSLADSITAKDVRNLKKKYPGLPVVTYVNTSAEVKAESDVCCTSSNALKIIESLPSKEIIFLPDELMAKNLQAQTSKKLITWKGHCIVHEDFKAEKIVSFRRIHNGLKVLAHTECPPGVADSADFVGGTEGMIHYIKKNKAPSYMLVTECGMSERMRVEMPDKEFIGMCGLCPYMKMNTLVNIRQALTNPTEVQTIQIPEKIRAQAARALQKMFELTNQK